MTTRLDYNSLTTGWINFFKANSTTLDTDLYASITTIIDADPDDINLYITRMPGITVNLVNHEEERTETGSNGVCRNLVTCEWHIGAHIYDILDYETARQDVRQLVTNIEDAIRGDDTASNTFHNVEIENAVFGNIIQTKKGTYQKSATIVVNTESFV